MEKIIIYDFDGTLTPYSLPKFEILEKAGVIDGFYNQKFLKICINRSKDEEIDLYLSIYYTFLDFLKKAGISLNDINFCLGCDKVEYNLGVSQFLENLCNHGVKNYLLSSGLKVFLENVSIASYFDDIYATTFSYNDDKVVTDISYLMSDKNKVNCIKKILSDNNVVDNDCSNVIYIDDGLTDSFAMDFVKNNGGFTIFVYQNDNNHDIELMREKNIVSLFTKADYSRDSEIDQTVRCLCKIKE